MSIDLTVFGISAAAGLFILLFPLLFLPDLRRGLREALRRRRGRRGRPQDGPPHRPRPGVPQAHREVPGRT